MYIIIECICKYLLFFLYGDCIVLEVIYILNIYLLQSIKIIDFGLASDPAVDIIQPLVTCCGSPAYAAPGTIKHVQHFMLILLVDSFVPVI